MTYEELKELRGLNRLIAYQQSKVTRLEARLKSASTAAAGEWCGSSGGDKTGNGVVALIAAKDELRRLEALRDERDTFIASIRDCNVRLAATLYFVDNKTWRQTAFRLGGGNTKDSVRKMCKRFFK